MQTTAVIKTVAVAVGEAASASGMANGPWYAVPANIWAAIIKQFKKSGGKQHLTSCGGLMKARKRVIDVEKKSGSVIWIGPSMFLFDLQTKMPYKMRVGMRVTFWEWEA